MFRCRLYPSNGDPVDVHLSMDNGAIYKPVCNLLSAHDLEYVKLAKYEKDWREGEVLVVVQLIIDGDAQGKKTPNKHCPEILGDVLLVATVDFYADDDESYTYVDYNRFIPRPEVADKLVNYACNGLSKWLPNLPGLTDAECELVRKEMRAVFKQLWQRCHSES